MTTLRNHFHLNDMRVSIYKQISTTKRRTLCVSGPVIQCLIGMLVSKTTVNLGEAYHFSRATVPSHLPAEAIQGLPATSEKTHLTRNPSHLASAARFQKYQIDPA